MNTLDTEALVERQGQCVLLANVLTMTQFMLERARKDEWELVTELEGQRRALLNECFATAVSPEHSEIFSEALAAMRTSTKSWWRCLIPPKLRLLRGIRGR